MIKNVVMGLIFWVRYVWRYIATAAVSGGLVWLLVGCI